MTVDEIVSRIRAHLGPHLLRPDFRRARPDGAVPAWGCCYVAAEAAWHAAGGPASGLKVMHVRHEGAPHWYLVDPATAWVVDPTADQFAAPPDYAAGKGKGFLTRAPSKRARALMLAAGFLYTGC